LWGGTWPLPAPPSPLSLSLRPWWHIKKHVEEEKDMRILTTCMDAMR
jgi:hypothetical protein